MLILFNHHPVIPCDRMYVMVMRNNNTCLKFSGIQVHGCIDFKISVQVCDY